MAKRRSFGSVEEIPGKPGIYVRFTWRGRRYRRSAGVNRSIAGARLAAIQAALQRGTEVGLALADVFGDLHGARLTFREAVEPYLVYARTRKKPSTLASDTMRLNLLKRAPWAGRVLPGIQAADIERWAQSRLGPRTSGVTVNRDLNLASAVFRWAVRCGYLNENPVRRVERFSERGRARETYLTSAESRALVEACDPGTRDVVLAALHTGMRRGELLTLRWRCVDLVRRELVVEAETEKAGRGRVVPMTTVLHSRFAARRRELPLGLDAGTPVFVLPGGREITHKVLRSAFLRAVRRCQTIPLEKREKVTFHCLRHTAASLLVAEGVPLFDVAKILGHSTLAVTMRYAHFSPEAGRAGIDKLGNALSGARLEGGIPPGGHEGGVAERQTWLNWAPIHA
jgi:integrase